MLFNSASFIFLFLPTVMLGYHLLGRLGRRPVIAWLALASVAFYAMWNVTFLAYLVGSILVNYLLANVIAAVPEDSIQRNRLMIFGISMNLLGLFYFKYLHKSLELLRAFHIGNLHPHPVLLPLGISFFTFTQISYLVDLAQDEAGVQDFPSYLLFVTFFPHLIAGPMLHHKEMMPQFGKESLDGTDANLDGALTPKVPAPHFALKADDVSLGLTWFLMGLAKKVLLADNLMEISDRAFSHAGSLTAMIAITGVVAYTMQLYFDFSGYSDMAIGLARIFSIRFPFNFDSPYKATSMTEYWQRWHITLTRYITLYLYNPLLLGVQRRRIAAGHRISRNAVATPAGFATIIAYPTILTMLLTGMWHGAGLQFLIFGLIHGIYLTANQAWRHFRLRSREAPSMPPTGGLRLAMMIGVYVQVAFPLIFFRSTSTHAAFALLRDMAGAHGTGSFGDVLEGWMAFALFPVVWFLPNTQQILGQETATEVPIPGPAAATTIAPVQAPSIFARIRWSPTLGWSLAMAGLFFAVLVELDRPATFLYFQF